MNMNFTYYDGEQTREIQVPSKMMVCDYCNGRGTQDCFNGGITADDECWHEPDFAYDYRKGVYSKPCETCEGRNVVEVVDDEALTEEVREIVDKQREIEEKYFRDCAAESQYIGYF